jgi:ketosteroid isomerase-like protein
MSAAEPDTIAAVADRLFAAIEQANVPALHQILDDEVAVWRVGAPRDDDKQRALKVLRWFIDVTTRRRYQTLDRQVFDDGSTRGFVQQHILHATGHAGESIALRVCIVIKLNADGLISRIDEYFDPMGIAPLLKREDKGDRATDAVR